MTRALAIAVAVVAVGAGCKPDPTCPTPTSAPADSPRLDEVWQIATHNSYWVQRGARGDGFASGTQERFVDQVLVDHARGLEIDVHPDPATPGQFLVFHTAPGDSLCDTLPECLDALRAIDHALPDHEPITIVVELKGITGPTFDDQHTFADLDRAFSDGLGARLFRPRDLLAGCACGATLSDCAAAVGFPPASALRGRWLVALIGNWDEFGGQATADWTLYATSGVADRVAFPMLSTWKLPYSSLSVDIRDLVTEDQLNRAVAESAVAQVEDTADPELPKLASRHALVRIDGANSASDQDARLALGAQLLQTDTPWIQTDDAGPAFPFRVGKSPIREPGTRALLLPAASAGERVFAWLDAGRAQSSTWEVTIGSGPSGEPIGCLRAAEALGSTSEESIQICRVKTAASRDPNAPPAADAETVSARVVVCDAGLCTTDETPSPGGASAPADLVALALTSGGLCAQPRVAGSIAPSGEVSWIDVGPLVCFAAPLRYQGIARPTGDAGETAPAHFVGLRRDAAFVEAAALTAVIEPPASATNPAPVPAPDRLIAP